MSRIEVLAIVIATGILFQLIKLSFGWEADFGDVLRAARSALAAQEARDGKAE